MGSPQHTLCLESLAAAGRAALVDTGPLGWQGSSGGAVEDVSGVAIFALALMILSAVVGIGAVLGLLVGSRRRPPA